MMVQKTAQGMVPLWSVKTGQRIERWPVVAKGMVASGEFSLEPVEGKDEPLEIGDERAAAQRGAVRDPYKVEFTPVITPSMDVVAGASSPLVPAAQGEAVLGASIAVTTLPAVEPVTLGQTGGTTAPGDDGLPKVTPLGQPAVHDRAPSAGKANQEPVRTSSRAGKGK